MIWENLKHRVFHSYLHPRHLAQRELRRLVALEASNLRGKLLDVGCGRKPYAEFFNHVDAYVGIDVPTTMHGTEFVDVMATAQALPFKDACFDGILCTEVLEHCPEPTQVLEEMRRVSKPGGYLLLTVPLSEQLHEDPFDFYRFTVHGLTYLLGKTGWQIQRIHPRGGTWLEIGYRLSSALYTVIGAKKDSFGASHPRLFLGPIAIFICAVVQWVASVINNLAPTPLSTIGYSVIARRS